MIESNGKRKLPPHHRLTLKDVKADRLAGLLTPKGAIFYTVIASHKAGIPIKINPKKLASELSMSRTSFYDAISKLKLERRIDFEAEGDLILRIPIDKKTGEPEYLSLNELSGIPDYQSGIPDDQSRIPDDQSRIPDDLSRIPDSKTSKTPPSNSSGALSTNTTITTNSFKERESDREEEENADFEFRNWLINRANSLPQKPALMEQWIEKEMGKAANKREFAQYQESRVAIPVPAILPQENLSPKDYWAQVEARRNGNG